MIAKLNDHKKGTGNFFFVDCQENVAYKSNEYWSKEDTLYLIQNAKTMSYEQLAAVLGRSPRAVFTKIRRLEHQIDTCVIGRNNRGHTLTLEDVNYIYEHPEDSLKSIATRLCVTERTVLSYRIGLAEYFKGFTNCKAGSRAERIKQFFDMRESNAAKTERVTDMPNVTALDEVESAEEETVAAVNEATEVKEAKDMDVVDIVETVKEQEETAEEEESNQSNQPNQPDLLSAERAQADSIQKHEWTKIPRNAEGIISNGWFIEKVFNNLPVLLWDNRASSVLQVSGIGNMEALLKMITNSDITHVMLLNRP
jgi:biotin operon repressor